MRTLSTTETAVLATTIRQVHTRVRVQNASGTWKVLTSLATSNTNWLDEVKLGENVDEPVPSAVYKVHKYQTSTDNLVPLATGSPLNVDDGGSYAALLDAGRRTDVSVAVIAASATGPAATDYRTIYDGEIDGVEWGSESVTIRSRDRLMGHLRDRWVEDETVYGTATGKDVETVISSVLSDWTDGRVTLWTPSSPGFAVTPYEQQRMSVLDAITQLAQLTGWDLRSRWRPSASAFQVKFFAPDRASATVDYTFKTSDIFDVRALDVDRTNIRNAWTVRYTTASGARATVNVTASDSINRFGRQWAGISLGSDSPIDTAAEANTFASAALSDTKDPQADQQTEQDFFWPIEVGDYYTFTADDRWYSTDQSLGVYGYRHTLSNTEQITNVKVRGTPAGQYLNWQPWADREDSNISKRPTVAMTVSQSGATGKLDLTVNDPHRTATKAEFSKKTTATTYAAFATTWDRSTGTPGDTSFTRGEDVSLVSKHNVSLRWKVSGSDDFGTYTQEGSHSFDSDKIAEVTGIEVAINDSNEIVVSAKSDEDTSNMYVTANSGSAPSDPTAGANDGTISGRSGTVNTGVTAGVGDTIHVKVVAEDDASTLGPVSDHQFFWNDVFPGEQITGSNPVVTGSLDLQGGEGNDVIRLLSQSGGQVMFLNTSGIQQAIIGYDGVGDEYLMDIDVDFELNVAGVFNLVGTQRIDADVDGIWIDQGAADSNILRFINSDVAHGVTDVVPTDVYFRVGKASDTEGGWGSTALSEGVDAMVIDAIGGAQTGTLSTAAEAAIMLKAFAKSGTGTTTLGSNENLAAIANGSTTRYIFQGDGEAFADIGWSAFSDRRLKSEIEALTYGLAEVRALTPKRYLQDSGAIGEDGTVELEGNPRPMFGFLAQEVREVLPELVKDVDTDESFYALDYARLTPVLWNALREISERLRALEEA